MTSEFQNQDRYTQEVNKITQGIKTLVTNLDYRERCSMKRGSYEGNYRSGLSYPADNYDSYPCNERDHLSSQRATKSNMAYTQSAQADLNYVPSLSVRKTPTGIMDSRPSNPLDDQSLKRISDLSISSSASYSSQSSADEINGYLRQTHIAVYKFNVRHEDEISLEVGDAVSLHKVHDEAWFEGTNLRTGQCGVFPSRYVSNMLQSPKKRDSASSSPISSSSSEANQFYLRFLGSVEVQDFKGNDVLCSAMKEIVKQHQVASISTPPYCTLDISLHGIKITEHQSHSSKSFNGKKQNKSKIGKLFEKEQGDHQEPSHFFDLKNVTFCGCHPNNSRYFAFITKHPEDNRFACHVFMSEFSTEPVAFAVGKSFKEFYNEFLDIQGPM